MCCLFHNFLLVSLVYLKQRTNVTIFFEFTGTLDSSVIGSKSVQGLAAKSLQAISSTTMQCECYNPAAPQECKNDKCEASMDHDKPKYCFALWTVDNKTGNLFSLKIFSFKSRKQLNGIFYYKLFILEQIKVIMKGCFTNNDSCNQTECIHYHSLDNVYNTHNYCCCKGEMCNTEHKSVKIPKILQDIHDDGTYTLSVQLITILINVY